MPEPPAEGKPRVNLLAADCLLVVLLAAHLLTVNVASAAPLVAVLYEWRGERSGLAAGARVGRFLAWQAFWQLLLGIGLGLAALGVAWWRYPATLRPALAHVDPSRYWYGGAELAVSLAALAVYAVTWELSSRRRFWHRLVAVFATTNLLYHFPSLFGVIHLLATRAELRAEPFRFVSLMTEPECLARMAHFTLASVAVSGVLAMARTLRLDPAAAAPDEAGRLAAWGGQVALGASLLQIPVGFYVLFELPEPARDALLGLRPWDTILFVAAIVLSVALLRELAASALGEGGRGSIVRSVVLVIVVVVVMVAVRQRAREALVHGAEEALAAQTRAAAQAAGPLLPGS